MAQALYKGEGAGARGAESPGGADVVDGEVVDAA
jgi:hypothetical protein